jgi:Ca-activated chloride channel family protein
LPSEAVVSGRFGSTAWQARVPLRQAAPGAGLPAHWARTKIAALLDQRRAGAPETDVRRSVIDLALRHHLVSAFTSLVAVDVTPVRPGEAPLTRHALKTNVPHGWEYEAVFGVGQGATPGPLHLATGLAALLLAAALGLALRRDPGLVLGRRRRGP